MKICILSRKPALYSTRRLVEAAQARGHQAIVIDTLRCYIDISSTRPTIHYRGKLLQHFDAVIPRIGASITFYGNAVVRQFEMMGVFVVNDSLAITRARDKLRTLQMLSRKGIDMPVTSYARSPDDVDDLIDIVGGAPLVIKLIEGTQGMGVILAETKGAAKSVIQAFMGQKMNILAQEFIKEAKGADIRCFVVGNKVVASMRRTACPGEFRSNLHRGGTAELIRLTAEERNTAIHTAQLVGLNVAGVDIIRSARGPLVLEVNASPGLKGIESVTGKNVADMIIQFIEKNVKPHTQSKKLRKKK